VWTFFSHSVVKFLKKFKVFPGALFVPMLYQCGHLAGVWTQAIKKKFKLYFRHAEENKLPSLLLWGREDEKPT